jgi:hypothetical protein
MAFLASVVPTSSNPPGEIVKLADRDTAADVSFRRDTDSAEEPLNAMSFVMKAFEKTAPADFTPIERTYIRIQLDRFFSTLPTVAEGFQLKVWRGGPHAKEPKLPPAAKSLLERGLMRLDTTSHFPRLFFTDAGLTGLRAMMGNRRLADPVKFAHVRQELGLEPISERGDEN